MYGNRPEQHSVDHLKGQKVKEAGDMASSAAGNGLSLNGTVLMTFLGKLLKDGGSTHEHFRERKVILG